MLILKRLRHVLAYATLTFMLAEASAQADEVDEGEGWVFMDLGEVLVTGNPTDGYTYVEGAFDFLRDLRAAGYKTALITNIPESWGSTCGAKFQNLRQFLASHLNEPIPMDWSVFDKVLLPPYDRYRKPASYLFVQALAQACPTRALYLGESQDELDIAKAWGFATRSMTAAGEVAANSVLPTVVEIEALMMSDFNFQHPANCNYSSLVQQTLLPNDQGLVSGCVISQ